MTVQRPATARSAAPVAGNNGLHPTGPPQAADQEDVAAGDNNGFHPTDTDGHALGWKNRRVLAERMGWPEGAVDVCEQVETAHPGWYPNYSPGGTWDRPEAGYYAIAWKPLFHRQPPLFGADGPSLTAAIVQYQRKHG